MSAGLKSTHSLQSKTLLIAAVPDGSEGAGEDRDQVNDQRRASKMLPRLHAAANDRLA
jgi:hypothetical protein